jgi:chemotaxis protein methyltransferase CheR
MDDQQFEKLLNHFNLSWKGYRKVRKGVKKRISRHMQELGCRRFNHYMQIISSDQEVEIACKRHLAVSISRFFRDRELWEVLRDKTLPKLIATVRNEENKGPFKVWSCGCARGEEAYSFRILWKEFKQERESCKNENRQLPEPELWATDINSTYLEMAMEGAYEYRSLKELPSNLVEKYFRKVSGKNRYVIEPDLKGSITFRKHDIIEEPPPSENFSIVFLRNNLLTYYRSAEKENALTRIVASMKTGASMIVGSHENLPDGFNIMVPSPHSAGIYYKRPKVRGHKGIKGLQVERIQIGRIPQQ